MKALHVFDMDGTLFSWKGWNKPVVARARRSIENPSVHAVLVTARPDALMRSATILQLRSQHLPFAEVRLSSGLSPVEFKRTELKRLLRTVQPTAVEFWDDAPANLAMFDAVMKPTGIPYKLHLVEM